MRVEHVYFAGVTILTVAAGVSGGFEAALWTSGALVSLYAFCLAIGS